MFSPRVASLFSGVGTFDYGFGLAGWESVYLCEWDPKAREVLSARFPGVPLTNDVTHVQGADLPDCDCVMFGSPCQDLSVGGDRAGMTEGSGTRSSLFFEAVRIIREKREASKNGFPRFALWENVCGAFSSNAGRDFAAVLAALVGAAVHVPEGGWRNAGVVFGPFGQAAWRVLDSQFFGVPQRRRRIFLVADFGGECAGEILFEPQGVSGHPPSGRKPGADITGCLTGGASSSSAGNPDDNRAQAGFLIPVSETAKCLTTSNQRIDYDTETLLPRVNPYGVRRLTPVETERLQGMPDHWTGLKGMADSTRYRFMGNGGTSYVLKFIAERMGAVLARDRAC